MTAPRLTDEHWQKLLSFKGYGNPAGPYWFVGAEEYGQGTEQELLTRATRFREIDDLSRVHSLPDLHFAIQRLLPTWGAMCKIVLRLKDDPDWWDGETCRRYQSQTLGITDGDTFLTELLPLPRPSGRHWPRRWPWSSWDEYARTVLPERIAALRRLFDANRPRFVFCYGKSFWPYHKKVFPEADFKPIVEGKVQMAALGTSTIALTPLLAWFLTTSSLIDQMAAELLRSP
jgi:hypothetical protein